MCLGGAERSLIGLLQALDYEQVEVDLFLNEHKGELMEMIPSTVRILPENEKYKALCAPIRQNLKKGRVLLALSRLYGKLRAKWKDKGAKNGGIRGEYSHKYTKWLMPQLCANKEYDLAISFITPHYFVAEKIKAKKKIAWIHTDYKQIALDVKSQLKMWDPYDNIVAVSEAVRDNFVEIFPSLKEKVFVMENILPKKMIEEQSHAFEPETKSEKRFKILSVGRFCEAKNFENIPFVAKELLSLGLDIVWYIIGYGADEEKIKNSIVKSGMQNNVIVLGKRANPYPYLLDCDLYVQPSRYEGKAVTVKEAQLLGKPVVITDFPTAKSQLQDGVDGIIVPLDNKLCANGIYEFLQKKEKVEAIHKNSDLRDYSNQKETEKIYKLFY